MKPRLTLWICGLLAASAAAAFAWFMRLPLPFEGFAIVAAGGLAFVATLSLVAFAPSSWVWSEAERLRMAFQARHGLTGDTAENVLEAIERAHGRAKVLRKSAGKMRKDMAERVLGTADRFDAAARELFYTPDRLRDLRAVLIRSKLIEDAALAHATLRQRKQAETEDTSRQKLATAIDALEAAFDATDLMAARGLLAEVETSSGVAETLLRPHNFKKTTGPSA
ncbi:hypothetical protein TRM7557_02196 [Tritonibacter multivorans]|uniref:5-bromo-4-chloroindolyl phosphate hydrolysis protein n=1 Tax=Tritonibacter multivorans TaxID=928856 RepID=A0A0P1GCN0_9RHOB|nr:hypothetical protein [Tritonibacter multivorans]MDA7422896.1 hypothetical protein [Tritonibacter multivorans]CUH79110.1 hypothetical protein TRM7557_02196 [Tritonibacter multivorans]SFD78203.1 hypothetical protein SAMN04488049_13012 [Tritonibacter multivorans]